MYITGNHDRGWKGSQIEISVLGFTVGRPQSQTLRELLIPRGNSALNIKKDPAEAWSLIATYSRLIRLHILLLKNL